jgi:hypothetical protein
MTPGRSCPLHYRYAPTVFARAADVHAETIYVIGGLYGNVPALSAILKLAEQETVKPTLIFNGDFNWFNADDASFTTINREVLKHIAMRGNVETEFAADADDAGCGCAYPDYVDDADVERSNTIMRRLRATARNHLTLTDQLLALPMHLVASVGDKRIGIVHGDAESLAGWRFAHDSLHEASNAAWLNEICQQNNLAGFASSHTCLPTLRRFGVGDTRHFVMNNGAAGMPNFGGTQYGLITRLSIFPAPNGLAQYGAVLDNIHVDAIPVHYDAAAFRADFLANWPELSAAHVSYFQRIQRGPNYAPPHALGLIRAPSVCA